MLPSDYWNGTEMDKSELDLLLDFVYIELALACQIQDDTLVLFEILAQALTK
ncbi:hypothetical protein [Vibrio barjaei]|jgi:hypothetical protein|uniref:hypothetical protein n=1 Tax=Vibrio barjaei TaxID=1676683 RepID=UPI000AD4AE12|nr:hypothetical protein [Vibrio barjaei]